MIMQRKPFTASIQALRLGNNIINWTTSERLLCVQVKFTSTYAVPLPEAIRRLLHESVILPYMRSDSVAIVEKLHARAGRIVYGSPWDLRQSAENV